MKTQKYYFGNNAFSVKRKADHDFWDEQWENGEVGKLDQWQSQRYIDLTKKYLPRGATILEGGCGLCGKLVALNKSGYNCIGIDYAEKTVTRVKSEMPDINIEVGDVRSLPYANESFDGYWSFGVIEHFWDGYYQIFAEGFRVIKPGGIFMLTFPTLSLLRRLKINLRLYKKYKGHNEPESFYQFFLNRDQVRDKLINSGFEIVELFNHNVESGVKQEIPMGGRIMGIIGQIPAPKLIKKTIAKTAEIIFSPVLGHVTVVVARRS